MDAAYKLNDSTARGVGDESNNGDWWEREYSDNGQDGMMMEMIVTDSDTDYGGSGHAGAS